MTSQPPHPQQPQQQPPNAVMAVFRAMASELKALASKIGDLEADKEEHLMVVDTLKPIEPTRKCFRLICGVLVERTVEQLLPSLQANLENIVQVIMQLTAAYKEKEQLATAYQKTHAISMQ